MAKHHFESKTKVVKDNLNGVSGYKYLTSALKMNNPALIGNIIEP